MEKGKLKFHELSGIDVWYVESVHSIFLQELRDHVEDEMQRILSTNPTLKNEKQTRHAKSVLKAIDERIEHCAKENSSTIL